MVMVAARCLKGVRELHFQIQSRRACPELVERGRLKIGRDAILDNLQASPRDQIRKSWFSHTP
jgi:hypothetical protein